MASLFLNGSARKTSQDQQPTPAAQSPQPKPLTRGCIYLRRLRNRLSQQAFRRRQAERMRELSSRVNTDQKSDNLRIEELQRENRQLRAQLVDVQARMSRLLANIQGLSDSVSKTLNDTGSQGDVEVEETEDSSLQLSTYDHKQAYGGPVFPGPSMQLEPFNTSSLNFDPPLAHQSEPGQAEDAFLSSELINVAGTSPFYAQIPNIWSFEYQTGIEPYRTAMAATQESSMALRRDMPVSNSPFSDHIKLLQHLLKSKLAANGFIPDSQPSMQSIYQPVLMVLSMFNSMTRPDVMAWYAKTRFFHIIELTAWQLYPSPATFQKLHQRYRPTDTQLKHPHPRVIDWIPFPSIRDRLIELHAANPLIDQIFCDAVTGYVVETVMSELISDAPQLMVYVRVTDLIAAMSSGAGNNSEDPPASLPAPDITTLFSSPSHARAAFKQLNMDKGASYYKIDPAFYAKYPELYDQSNDLTANGVPLKPRSQKVLTYPKPLDDSMVETYRSFIDFSMDATSTISSTTAPFEPDMPSQFPDPTATPRYSFLDDYSEGAHPALLKAILAGNTSQEAGYGGDSYCDLARQRIRRHLGRDDVGIFFVPSGTSANAISIAACLRPHEAAIAASSGHIVTRETGAVEASGHKIINVAPVNGKLTPQSIQRAVDENWHFPHMAKPRLVYISNATEIGTIYKRDELAAIKQVCEQNQLILFLDGARIGTALASKSNDMTLQDILELTDIFWIGGTKNGALLGEAVVVKDARLATEFEFYVKQHGSLLAKSRIMGAQFAELFREDLYSDLARLANYCAETLSSGIATAGFSVHAVTETNQVFAVLPMSLIKVLQGHFIFYVWEKRGDDEAVVRLLTTWATEATEVEKFVGLVQGWSTGAAESRI
ncbi:pyridoxal phosphate-dependent transferase [Colletotrichum godetiae]|uniref:Pyridoxal phosphate-dependent transferase n=1 Tax=Colletotrichum godetiae TaxID=1209918 RepID=A0AAJ0ETT4_9PEZI|nr:pyridoxal phosphate-dependent transferase [Colletotrichum godetiae]KAK1673643.1 pyridoxal phosphate-dependent transferase [Colletotrichum godetiae]